MKRNKSRKEISNETFVKQTFFSNFPGLLETTRRIILHFLSKYFPSQRGIFETKDFNPRLQFSRPELMYISNASNSSSFPVLSPVFFLTIKTIKLRLSIPCLHLHRHPSAFIFLVLRKFFLIVRLQTKKQSFNLRRSEPTSRTHHFLVGRPGGPAVILLILHGEAATGTDRIRRSVRDDAPSATDSAETGSDLERNKL